MNECAKINDIKIVYELEGEGEMEQKDCMSQLSVQRELSDNK